MSDEAELERQRAWASDLMNRRSRSPRSAEQINADRDCLRRRFGRLYTDVLEILQRHDPVRIAFVPDEYEPEVDTILLRLEGVSSEDELRRIIYEEFVWWFSTAEALSWQEKLDHNGAGPESKYEGIASEIWRLLGKGKAHD